MKNQLSEKAQSILDESMKVYRVADKTKKNQYINHVHKMLEVHESAKNNIGFGFDDDTVQAGKAFIETINRTQTEISIKVKSAVRTHFAQIVAGVTKNDSVIIFLSKDYDNQGNVYGPYEILSDNGNTDAFHQVSGNYSDESIQELGWTKEEISDRLKTVEHFKTKCTKGSRVLIKNNKKNGDPKELEAKMIKHFDGNYFVLKIKDAASEMYGEEVVENIMDFFPRAVQPQPV